MKRIRNRIITQILFGFFIIGFLGFKTRENPNPPIEKIYTQTDRPFYFPGETIWFKSYIVKENNTASSISDIVNAQLISPKGAVVHDLRLSVKNGYAYGDFIINSEWVGGIYTLKVYTNWMRNFGEDCFFTKQITVQKVVKPNLLMDLQFENKGYGKGAKVTANFEVKDLKNNPLSQKSIAYEVSAKGKKIIEDSSRTDTFGKIDLSFNLPEDLETTDVVLNLKIEHQGSTESTSKRVPIVLNSIDLQFMPESGKIIAGTENSIAFKAIDEFAKPVDVGGKIIDKSGKTVSTFTSFHDGMGRFELTAKKNEKYFAVLNTPFQSETQIALPKVYLNGTTFSATNEGSNIKLEIFNTGSKELQLEVSNSMSTIFHKELSPQVTEINVDISTFPMGISKFSIKNPSGDILAERLVFIKPEKQLCINIEMDKALYQTREKVKLKITTTNTHGKPIPSNLSLSIADNKLLSFVNDKQDDILSHLLLSSELQGKIHEPAFYFDPEEEKSKEAIDLLMLTHGWRSYIGHNAFTLDTAEFLPEQHVIQSGVVLDKKGKPSFAHLLLMDKKGNKVLVFDTDEKGNFSFKYTENKSLVLLAYREDGKSLQIKKTDLRTRRYANTKKKSKRLSKANDEFKAFDSAEKPLQKSIKDKAVASDLSLEEDSAQLEEIVITGYSGRIRSSAISSIVTVSSDEISRSSTATQVLQGMVSGVNITTGNGQPGNNATIIIRGRNSISSDVEPLFIIDGVPANQSSFRNLRASEIFSMSVLKDGAATAIFGNRGSGGVILVNTKGGGYINNQGKKRLNNSKYNNYAIAYYYNYGPSNTYQPRLFYIPKYDSKEFYGTDRNDFRQTIYWNPVVQTDENGQAELEFFNSDAITSFRITTEGIGYNGNIGRREKSYATKKLLNVDFKTPNYMVLKDSIILPVTVTNETNETIGANLGIILPENLELIEKLSSEISVPANSSVKKNLALRPIKKGVGTIEIKLVSGDIIDVVKKDVEILSPYFPTETSISGSNSKNFEFEINHLVEGTLKADFEIYTDVIGDVMNGIESLIRQPYGCFEQTSSATYPNIMVLKYLKESGKSNPEIEAKAIDFIKKGYNKLVSFETNQGGFEWFGNTPPHETLTAYGVLEFTEMKEVFSGVDQKMIDRTVEWLMSRKDGQGGFKKSKKGYDSFASSPVDVANAYIIYALSESGIKTDLNLEYQTALKESIRSKDSYKMALLALASNNLGKSTNYEIGITTIKENISEFGFEKLPVKNTITRSYGNAKNIETVAFTLMALMRENNPNLALISKGIEYLVSLRSGGRFGSTQSTTMALKALIDYTKFTKKQILVANDNVNIMLNDKSITMNLNNTKNGKISKSELEKYFKEGKQLVQVRFNNSGKKFPYSLNVKWESYLPNTSIKSPIGLNTTISKSKTNVGDNLSYTIDVTNKTDDALGMVTSILGIPSGSSAQPWQLKELLEQNKVAYYEVFDNYLVLYWTSLRPKETKSLRLDLKAEIAGNYQAPASTAYLYYGDEFKTWIKGNKAEIGD